MFNFENFPGGGYSIPSRPPVVGLTPPPPKPYSGSATAVYLHTYSNEY